MNEDKKAILKRLRRKVEIMHFDFKAVSNMRQHDTEELLKLIQLLESDT